MGRQKQAGVATVFKDSFYCCDALFVSYSRQRVGPLDGNPDEQGGIVESYVLLGNTGTFWTESPIAQFGRFFIGSGLVG